MALSDNLVIIKYNAGNIRSVLYALERIGRQGLVTDDPDEILSAGKVIFPGVGEARSAMHYLKERGLDELIRNLRQPVLGICLGMQLMCTYSEENETPCLGIFDTVVRKFVAGESGRKVPQIGWNQVHGLTGPLFRGIPEAAYCYFVHSYYAGLCYETIAATDYGIRFSSGLSRDNFYGLQFHPEKSAVIGERILENFLNI